MYSKLLGLEPDLVKLARRRLTCGVLLYPIRPVPPAPLYLLSTGVLPCPLSVLEPDNLLLSMGDALLSRLPLLFVPLYCCSWLLLPVVALLYFWSGVLLLLPAGL